jgi:DNA-binding winged helix-turn-helix (wHTH) protein
LSELDVAGEVVSKGALIAGVWPNTFVVDSNLKAQINQLRRALGEPHAGECHIVTIPGGGTTLSRQSVSRKARCPMGPTRDRLARTIALLRNSQESGCYLMESQSDI